MVVQNLTRFFGQFYLPTKLDETLDTKRMPYFKATFVLFAENVFLFW